MKKLTVKEYAESKGVSVQAVYKKIDNGKLKTVEEERNRRYITLIVVDDEGQETREPENKPSSTGESTSTPQDSTPENKPSSTNDLNQAIVELLREQLQEKDKQIERLQKINEEQLKRLTELLYHSQQIEKLLGLPKEQDTNTEYNNIVNVDTAEQPEQDTPEPERKQGFFARIFKRKKGE